MLVSVGKRITLVILKAPIRHCIGMVNSLGLLGFDKFSAFLIYTLDTLFVLYLRLAVNSFTNTLL